MHLRTAYPLFILFSVVGLALGAPDGAKKPKPSATPTQPPKPSPSAACSKELLCCLKASKPSDASAKLILDLLHINLSSEQQGEEVGLTCSTLQKRGFGDTCFTNALCCDSAFQAGIIAVGCNAVSI